MRKIKRAISLFLVTVLVVMCSVTAFAAPEPPSESRIAGGHNWFKATTKSKTDITSITFEVGHEPEASASETWDASDPFISFKDTVKCYLYDTDLIISAEVGDKIYPQDGTTADNSNFVGMFQGFSNVESIDGLDILVVQGCRLKNMFQGCASLKELDLSGWDVDYNVNTVMDLMFADCTSLEHINFGGWTHIGSNYSGGDRTFRTTGLKEIDIPAIGYMQYAWGFIAYNPNLITVNIPNFNTSGWSDQVIFGNPKLTEITFGSGFASTLVSKPGYLQKPSATNWKYAGEKWYDDTYTLVDSWADYPSGGTFYAIKYCDVSFKTASGSQVESQTVHRENCADQPDDPTWAGRDFLGWYADPYYIEEFDFNEPILTDVVVYAKWSGEPSPTPPGPIPPVNPDDEGEVPIYDDRPVFTASYLEEKNHYDASNDNTPPTDVQWIPNADGTWSAVTLEGVITGWKNITNVGTEAAKSSWYYFDANGIMLTGWQWIKDGDGITRCYYFNEKHDGTYGAMYRDGVINGYTIDKNGAWTVDGVVQTK